MCNIQSWKVITSKKVSTLIILFSKNHYNIYKKLNNNRLISENFEILNEEPDILYISYIILVIDELNFRETIHDFLNKTILKKASEK